ncbi:MAG: amino acid permease [Gemmatimonadaceae bacterium]|nr:amino acid permease [Gemmatimonadaceae bacterium]
MTTPNALKRTLSTTDLTVVVIGNVIGSGIFIVPAVVLRQTGSVTGAMLVWLIGGALSLFGALSYGELGGMDASSGGLYAYTRDAFGRFAAFLYGWTMFFVVCAGTVAALAVAATTYIGQLVTLDPWMTRAIPLLLILIIGITNVRGSRESAQVLNWTTGLKVVAIVVMSLLLITMGEGTTATAVNELVPPASPLNAAATAMISVLWAYEGWQYVTFSAGEAHDPQKSLPRAIAIGTAILIGIYLLANLGYLAALGPDGVAASDAVASDATAAVLGPWAGKAIAFAIVVSMYSAAHATVMTIPRVFFSMAQDGLLFKRLGAVHPKYGTPAAAIIAACVWAAILAMSGTFDQLLTYVIFIGWIFYALGAVAVLVLRHTRPDAPRPFKVPGYPFTPLLFVLAAMVIIANQIVGDPRQSAIGLGVVLAGVPAYVWWTRRVGERAAKRDAPAGSV